MFEDRLDGNDEIHPINDHHKEFGAKRIKLDACDRKIIINEIKKNRNPLNDKPEDVLTNIVSGCEAPENVNVHGALQIG